MTRQFKTLVAKLAQAASIPGRPVFLINLSNAGHGGIGSSEDQQAAVDTYLYEFMYDPLGVKWVSISEASK